MPITKAQYERAQTRLGKQYAGKIDGIPGPMFWIGMFDFAAPSQPNGSDAITLRGRKFAEVYQDFGMIEPARIAGYLSNTSHETGDFKAMRENLYYSKPERIMAVWPSRFPTVGSAAPFAKNPIALANKVYGDRMGNRGSGTMDGWNYRGAGDIQTTGLSNFKAAQLDLGLPLLDNPSLSESPTVAMLMGLSYWRRNNVNRFYDAGTPKRARAYVNTGSPDKNPIGWEDTELRHNRIMGLFA